MGETIGNRDWNTFTCGSVTASVGMVNGELLDAFIAQFDSKLITTCAERAVSMYTQSVYFICLNPDSSGAKIVFHVLILWT